jgi:hypothetical protein
MAESKRRRYGNYKRYLQRCEWCGEDHECTRADKRTCSPAHRQALFEFLQGKDTPPFTMRTKHEAERAKLEMDAALFKPSTRQKGT